MQSVTSRNDFDIFLYIFSLQLLSHGGRPICISREDLDYCPFVDFPAGYGVHLSQISGLTVSQTD